jgi:hypothetical protein
MVAIHTKDFDPFYFQFSVKNIQVKILITFNSKEANVAF